MRTRSNSGVRLDYYQRIVHNVIMVHQHPVTGLFPASPHNNHAWIRDNVYCILTVWGLSMAYKKIADADEDRAKIYELEQSCVKLMRGLLMAMLKQKEKVERFKSTQCPSDSLHAKYSCSNGETVVGDNEWGHLQIDAISLYLLILAQMTASGLQIVFSLDEVAFIQNLVFYIESAYCIPDYGIWERGDKANHGLPELNASSIGMAKAALEAMNELDLFGARGGPCSVIHVLADEAQKCRAVLQSGSSKILHMFGSSIWERSLMREKVRHETFLSLMDKKDYRKILKPLGLIFLLRAGICQLSRKSMLPRESNSKEIDSGLLAIISFPAFAVDDSSQIQLTRNAIVSKLMGRYGCKRFLRDGYKTPKEDPNRLYYEPWELRIFEHIECEWPLFFCYLILDSCFTNDIQQAIEYTERLEEVMVKSESGFRLVPELYAVPSESVAAEYANPGSQKRISLGRCPFLWAQSLYILGKLLLEGFIAVGELDPLNRRLCSEKKPDVVVQVVIVAEDESIRSKLQQYDIYLQTVNEVLPIEIQPAKVLSYLFTYLGRNKKLGLSGRSSRDVGILSTSKLYSLHDRIIAFTPQKTDLTHFYIASDHELMIDIFKSEINFLKSSWQNMLGRPLVILNLKHIHLDKGKVPLAMITTIKKLKSGYINGTRVVFGNLGDFLTTSSITNLSFLGSQEEGLPDRLDPEVEKYLEEHLEKKISRAPITEFLPKTGPKGEKLLQRKMSVKGAIKKTRSINVEPDSLGMQVDEPVSVRRSLTFETSAGGMEMISSPDDEKVNKLRGRSPSPESLHYWKHSSIPSRTRTITETQFASTEVEELLAMLGDTDTLEDEGDILQYLIDTQGLQFKTGILEDGKPVTVRDLLKTLYEKACQQKRWGLIRHTAGMLGKRAEDLAKSVTDLVVRQKQVTIGMPPTSEQTITGALPDYELRQIIHQAYGDDQSSAMLTQELILYLAMFIRTEPQLFLEMLRLRVGLIIQVMAAELSRSLACSGEEASEHLLNLSPFEMKNLLYHILSGKEFALTSEINNENKTVREISVGRGNYSIISCKSSRMSRKSQIGFAFSGSSDIDFEERSEDRQGQWLRRRRLDGALNRVPREFYPFVWSVLEKCQGLAIEGRLLPHNLTQEMTSGELKFALAVETALNSIPQPEYRQLMVEALMVLTLVTEHDVVITLGNVIAVDQLVHQAHALFLQDQAAAGGDATLCCTKKSETISSDGSLLCGGAAYICQHFYDSAPSGSYGTMTYIARAVAKLISNHPQEQDSDCSIN